MGRGVAESKTGRERAKQGRGKALSSLLDRQRDSSSLVYNFTATARNGKSRNTSEFPL